MNEQHGHNEQQDSDGPLSSDSFSCAADALRAVLAQGNAEGILPWQRKDERNANH